MLKQEFLAAMQTHFLDGKDEGFDYSRIENDEQYVSLDMRERDENVIFSYEIVSLFL